MHRRLLPLGLAAVVTALIMVAFAYLQSPRSTRVRAGQVVPELELPFIGDQARGRLSSFRQSVVLLVFFDTQCAACPGYARELERIHRRYVQQGLVVLGVSLDRDVGALVSFVPRNEITFLVLRDPEGTLSRPSFGVVRAPESYLIDRNGRVQDVFVESVDWRSPEHQRALEALLPRPRLW